MRENCLVLDYIIVKPLLEYKYSHFQCSEKKKGNHLPWLMLYAQNVPLERR